jgi:membrane associated rhomboid family serine protease
VIREATPGGAPQKARRRRRPIPFVTLALIGAYVAIEATIQAGGEALRYERLSVFGQERQAIWGGEFWRLITCTFLHGNLWHMVLNSFATFLFGRVVETWVGHWRFFVYHCLFGLAGSLAFQAFSDFGVGVGASGAVCGLIGVFLVGRTGRRQGGQLVLGARFWKWISMAVCLLLVESTVIQIFKSDVRIADSAHFGGIFAGVLGGAFVFTARGSRGLRRRVRVGFLVSLFFFGLGTYGLAFPVFDWSWYVWRVEKIGEVQEAGGEIDRDLVASLEERARHFGGDRAVFSIVQMKVARGEVDEARRYWLTRPPESLWVGLTVGGAVYDGLYVAGYRDGDLDAILDQLIELADQGVAEDPDNPTFLNASAWYRALRDTDLETAKERAEKALKLVPGEASILNTLGWVHWVRGETAPGFHNLEEAVNVSSAPGRAWAIGDDLYGRPLRRHSVLGENLLYLGLAYYENGQIDKARNCAVSARRAASPEGLEDRSLAMLEELEASLGI